MRINLIAAMARNRVIGRDNRMPWHIPEDLKHFKRVTLGHPVIMGRKTYESIGRLLPGRENIILSRNPDYRVEGAQVLESLAGALDHLRDKGVEEAFVIGGGHVYREALSRADRLYLTEIDLEVEGDATFPEFDPAVFGETERQPVEGDPSFSFVTYERV